MRTLLERLPELDSKAADMNRSKIPHFGDDLIFKLIEDAPQVFGAFGCTGLEFPSA